MSVPSPCARPRYQKARARGERGGGQPRGRRRRQQRKQQSRGERGGGQRQQRDPTHARGQEVTVRVRRGRPVQASCGQGRGARPEGWRPCRPSADEHCSPYYRTLWGEPPSTRNDQGARAQGHDQGRVRMTPGTPKISRAGQPAMLNVRWHLGPARHCLAAAGCYTPATAGPSRPSRCCHLPLPCGKHPTYGCRTWPPRRGCPHPQRQEE